MLVVLDMGGMGHLAMGAMGLVMDQVMEGMEDMVVMEGIVAMEWVEWGECMV